jgi:hypothetical protein
LTKGARNTFPSQTTQRPGYPAGQFPAGIFGRSAPEPSALLLMLRQQRSPHTAFVRYFSP